MRDSNKPTKAKMEAKDVAMRYHNIFPPHINDEVEHIEKKVRERWDNTLSKDIDVEHLFLGLWIRASPIVGTPSISRKLAYTRTPKPLLLMLLRNMIFNNKLFLTN